MALKSLFGNLVKNYGDDALKFAANQGDEIYDLVKGGNSVLDSVGAIDDLVAPPINPHVGYLEEMSDYFGKQARDNALIEKMDGLDSALRNGGFFDLNSTSEYLENLRNPTVWKPKNSSKG